MGRGFNVAGDANGRAKDIEAKWDLLVPQPSLCDLKNCVVITQNLLLEEDQ